MCGIAVMLGLAGKPAERLVVERMTERLLHRGPDEGGVYIEGSVGLGFRRLSILDLSDAAHQPMVSEDGGYVLVFNGEIFNYIELREELGALGHRFRSSGDSEVLLNAYREWGPDCLPKLNGMWAFVIYDRKNNRLFGSRDRFGIKPLYCYRDKNHVLFASEIKAIRASGLYQGELNWKIASRFLLRGQLDDSNECFYLGINQIPPGSAFEVHLDGRWRQWQYWSLSELPSIEVENPAQAFAQIFEDSVRLQMRSDVPVGVCLSGGIDSTSIICAAARQCPNTVSRSAEPLLAFCYMAKEFDESVFISDTVALTGAELRILRPSPLDLWNTLRSFIWYQDEPAHNLSVLLGFDLMRLVAANGIRVVLNGQGSDETIGGYSSFFDDYWQMLLKRGRLGEGWREINSYVKVHGGNHRHLFITALLRLLAQESHQIAAYSRLSSWRHHKRAQTNPWFTQDLAEHLPFEELSPGDGTLNGSLRQSVVSWPLPLYLRIEDRNSMAHSVEARLPFLDYRLVSLLFNISEEWKVRGPWNKFILREAMRQRIPESVRTRPDKMGFPSPWKNWFSHDLYEPMMDLLTSHGVRERGIYNVPTIVQDLEQHRTGQVDVTLRLCDVAQFETLMNLQGADPLRYKPLSHLTSFEGCGARSMA